jgi:hypothetical protein
MTDKMVSDDEFVIHLDLAGLSALMKAAEAAMATGRGRIEPGCGVSAVRSGSASFAGVTLTFSDCGAGRIARRREQQDHLRL